MRRAGARSMRWRRLAARPLRRRACPRRRPPRRPRRRQIRRPDHRHAGCRWPICARSCRWRRCISPTTSRRSKRSTERLPGVPQVACFDTSFHRGQPAVADVVPLPRELCGDGVQRYGFHGLSYEYIASVLPQAAPEIANGRVIVAHLGSGASLCAMHDRKSVDSTLGFTALDGLCMGTRPGSIDPGVILHLFQTVGLSAEGGRDGPLQEVRPASAISGVSNDMRDLLASREPAARARHRLFRLPRGQGNRRAGGRARRHRRAGLHRRHRRELARDPQADLRGLGVARHRAGRGREPAPGRAYLHRGQPRVGVGHSDERGTDHRPSHGCPARARRVRRLTLGITDTRSHDMAGDRNAHQRIHRGAVGVAGISAGPLAERHQRPRLHSAELRAVRRRRLISGRPDRPHHEALAHSHRPVRGGAQEGRAGRLACSELDHGARARLHRSRQRDHRRLADRGAPAARDHAERRAAPGAERAQGLRIRAGSADGRNLQQVPQDPQRRRVRRLHGRDPPLPQLARADRPARRVRAWPHHRRLPPGGPLRRCQTDRHEAGGEEQPRPRSCRPTR